MKNTTTDEKGGDFFLESDKRKSSKTSSPSGNGNEFNVIWNKCLPFSAGHGQTNSHLWYCLKRRAVLYMSTSFSGSHISMLRLLSTSKVLNYAFPHTLVLHEHNGTITFIALCTCGFSMMIHSGNIRCSWLTVWLCVQCASNALFSFTLYTTYYVVLHYILEGLATFQNQTDSTTSCWWLVHSFVPPLAVCKTMILCWTNLWFSKAYICCTSFKFPYF